MKYLALLLFGYSNIIVQRLKKIPDLDHIIQYSFAKGLFSQPIFLKIQVY